jgi:hypothetical protein
MARSHRFAYAPTPGARRRLAQKGDFITLLTKDGGKMPRLGALARAINALQGHEDATR